MRITPSLLSVLLVMSWGAFAQGPPNILFIYTDDQGPWALGASGNTDAHTPNMDELFSEGVTLVNSFVVTPVCSPSRAELLTSRYGTELGIEDWISPRGGSNRRKETHLGLDPESNSWVRDLRDAGYRTGLVGKWHLGELDKYYPTVFGYEHFFGFRTGGNKVEDPTLELNGKEKVYEGLTTDILTDGAIDFLRKGGGEQPFLLSVHYRAPHAPWKPVADEDWAPFENLDPNIPNPNFPDLDVDRVKRVMREYLASVAGVDRNLGRILNVLEEEGYAENTIVIFTSDHGYNVGHHGVLHKGNGSWITKSVRDLRNIDPRKRRSNMFDTSLRVPTAVRWPGHIELRTEVDEVITNLDWYPTILAMAGVELPEGQPIRGRNFLSLLNGESVPWDNTMYAEYSQHHYVENHMRVIRTPKWKLMRDFKNEGRDELYHLAEDPNETTNLIDNPEYDEKEAELHEMLLERMAQIGGLERLGLSE